MANETSYGDISPRTAAYAVKKLLKRGQAETVVDKFAQIVPVPKNKSKKIVFRRYETLGKAMTPLTEGVTPTEQKLTKTDVEATLQQYGGLAGLTDVINDTHEDPILNEMADLIGEQAGETLEAIKIGILNAATNRFYCGGTATASVSKPIDLSMLRMVNRAFRRVRARKITQIIKAGPNIATEPVGASFVLLGHSDLEADIREITGFVPVEKYAGLRPISEFEVGKVENFRVILTSMFEPELQAGATVGDYLSNGVKPPAIVPGEGDNPATGGGKADVYTMIAIARDAYAFTPLAGKNAATISVLNPGKISKSDPLGQRGYVGWKSWMAGAILQDTWIANIECAATAQY